MIRVTRLDGSQLTINCDLVESVERTPDTVVSLVNNHKLVVRESVEEIVDRVVAYRARIQQCPFMREQGVPTMIQAVPDHRITS